jgi:hypothetical protein
MMIAFGKWVVASFCISQVDARHEGCECPGSPTQPPTSQEDQASAQIADLLKNGSASVHQATEWLKKLNGHSADGIIDKINQLKKQHKVDCRSGKVANCNECAEGELRTACKKEQEHVDINIWVDTEVGTGIGTVHVVAHPVSTASQLKELFRSQLKRTGYKVENMRLWDGDRQMQDDLTMSDYNIHDGGTVRIQLLHQSGDWRQLRQLESHELADHSMNAALTKIAELLKNARPSDGLIDKINQLKEFLEEEVMSEDTPVLV